MKKILSALVLYLFLMPVWANTCLMVIPFPPGGSSDLYGRIIQKYNSDIVINFKPGAYASHAISTMRNNKDSFMISVPNMYSEGNPDKNPNVELVKVLFVIDAMIVTTKNIKFSNLITDKLNIGVNTLGSTQHLISLQIKKKNPKLEVVPFGGDTKALSALLSGDIDAYIVSSPIGNQWLKQHKTMSLLAEIPSDRPFKYDDLRLTSLNLFGVFVSKDASVEQKQHVVNCLQKSTSNPNYRRDFSDVGITVVELSDKDRDSILKRHLDALRESGL